jgi:flagellum-specific peptidoglycan hydrolase FlgJ
MVVRSRRAERVSRGQPKRSRRARSRRRLGQGVLLPAGLLAVLVALGVAREEGSPWPSAPRSAAPRVVLTTEQTGFVRRVGGAAQRLRPTIGLPPSLVTAMAINETGWGTSTLSKQAHNYFGIKAEVGQGTAGYVVEDTQEVVGGRVITVRAPFRAYHSLEDSLRDLGAFLHANPRYDALWASADDPRASARVLARSGYATDPAWANKLIALIEQLDLEALDGSWWAPDWGADWGRHGAWDEGG